MATALVVLVNVVGGGISADGPPADVVGSATTPLADLPPVDVTTPPVTPAADLACPVLMQQLPAELAGDPSRMVRSQSPYAYAWGEPAVVLLCGVDPPAGFAADSGVLEVNGVQWFVDTGDPGTVVWTTVDRVVPVQVRVPASSDSAAPTALSPVIATALPYTPPKPNP